MSITWLIIFALTNMSIILYMMVQCVKLFNENKRLNEEFKKKQQAFEILVNAVIKAIQKEEQK